MRSLSQLYGRFRTKPFLIGIAVLLLVLNLGKATVSYFAGRQAEVESRLALLEQHRLTAGKLSACKEKVLWLEARKKQLDVYLFSGDTPEEIASAMQILLQDKVARAGLEPESLRPILRSEKDKDATVGEIAVKLRLNGTLNEFSEFIVALYRSKQLFTIESFILKPYKNTKLKILLDLKGYYRLG